MSFVLHPERFSAELVPQAEGLWHGNPGWDKNRRGGATTTPPEIVAALN